MASFSDDDELPTFNIDRQGRRSESYAIPRSPAGFDRTHWLGYGQSLDIAGFHIRKCLLYVGSVLPGSNGRPDPSLIDPRLPVPAAEPLTEHQPCFSPSYSELPHVRKAYLKWLADGRSAPDANIALVFLYFYGIERRVILDILRDGTGTSDFPDIYKELKRLYHLYAPRAPSFGRYCGHLIELVEVAASADNLYERPIVAFSSSRLSFLIRLAVGQAMRDGVPVPAHLALAWAEQDPGIVRRMVVSRCAPEFRELFRLTYAAMHSKGLVLKPNKTKLKLVYEPASMGFHGSGGVNMHFGEIPDVAALTGPTKLLQQVVDACVQALEPFSRYLGRNPDGRTQFEAVLTLPVQLWPEEARLTLEMRKARVDRGMQLTTFGELQASLEARSALAPEQQRALFSALQSYGIGSEPELVPGARRFEAADCLVLFPTARGESVPTVDASYRIARLSVELAAAVAHADGAFCSVELAHLEASIKRWDHLHPAWCMRLQAYAQFLQTSPAPLSGLKKRVEALDAEARESVAEFAASMVLADSVATSAEVQLLEKIYQQLGIEREKAYSAIHGRNGGLTRSENGRDSSAALPGKFSLDPTKIAALQASSDRIAARLATIFETEPEPQLVPTSLVVAPETTKSISVMGLDAAHSAFARLLTSRASWQRVDLIDVADDLAIMLDGALERLNEASLDAHDIMFAEEGDPIDINPEIMEKLAQ